MAISFVGSAENSAISGGDVTLTLPAMQEGDLVIVAYSIGDQDGIDFDMAMVTAGYTEVADLFGNDTNQVSLGVFWKVMGATPDTTAQVDGQGGTNASVAAVAMVFRGVDTTTPMDVTPTTATGINTFHPNPPSIDHLNPSGLWTVIAAASGHSRGGAVSYTFPANYTTNAIDRASDDTSDTTVGMGYRTNPADPEDPGALTHSGTDSVAFAWCAATLALRPAAGAQTITASAIGSLEAFGSGKLNLRAAASAIASAEALGTAKLNMAINPSAISSAEAIGTAKVMLSILTSGIASTEAFGTAQVRLMIAPVALASGEAFGTGKINRNILAQAIASAEALGVPVVTVSGAAQTISPSGIASAEAFGTARLGLWLFPTGISSAQALGVGKIVLLVTPSGIATAEVVGQPTITSGVIVLSPSRKLRVILPALHKLDAKQH